MTRRTFSAATYSALLALSLASPGCAQTAAPVVAPATTAPRLPASAGINLSSVNDWNTEMPFVDLMKSSREWISQQPGAKWGGGPPLELDAQGWVKKLEPNSFIEVPMLTGFGSHAPKGDYVLLWEGKGTLEIRNASTLKSEPGRIVFQPKPDNAEFWLKITAIDPADYPRNIRVLLPGHEKTYQKEPFNPTFLERWKGVSSLRFMDWGRTNGSPQQKWVERPKPDFYSYSLGGKGVPIEVMLDLSNRLNADPWLCVPHLADDDYIRNMAILVKEKLKPNRKVYLEYSNEMWNQAFSQTKWSMQKGTDLNLGAKERPWEGGARFYVRRSVEIFKVWAEVFGGSERLVRCLGWQAGNVWWADNMILSFEDAHKHTDALAIAPYIDLGASPNSKPSSDEIAKWPIEQLMDFIENQKLPEAIHRMKAQKGINDKYNVQLIAYEGGQHLVGGGGGENNAALTQLFQAANRHPRIGTIYDKYFQAWKETGGGTFCHFSSVGVWVKWGSWGILQYADDKPEDNPKYTAFLRFAQSCGQNVGAAK